MERIAVDLSGVPQTLLWNLGRRAEAARSGGSVLRDPRAVEVVDRLDYDFADARRGAQWHAVRVATFDAAVRRFRTEHPAGTVVALGEGLETQFWRVDNGTMRWLTVDLPETLAVRRRLLPDGPRQRSHAGSALEPGWLDQVDPAEAVLVTAQGLLMYFRREEVHQLIATIAGRLPDSSMVLDVVPEAMLRMVGRRPDSEQATRLWTWTFNAEERAAIGAIRGVASVRDLTPPLAPAVAPLLLGAVHRLPRRVALRHTSVPSPRGHLPAAVTAATRLLTPDDEPTDAQTDPLTKGLRRRAARLAWHCGYMTRDDAGTNHERVTVYWRPGCTFCMRLRLVLRWHRLHPRMINIWRDPDAAAFVRSVADGNETVPTVVIDGRPVVNPSPRVVAAALRAS